MLRSSLMKYAAGLAAAASLSFAPVAVQAGGGCGCEAPCQTVYHVHQRCHHGCRHCPPVGMLVPSAPVMPMVAAPMAMAPIMAAPVAMAVAPAPTYTLAQAPPQFAAPPQTCASQGLTQEQVMRAVSQALANAQGGSGFGAAAGPSAEERLSLLEKKVDSLFESTQAIKAMLEAKQKGN